LPQPPHHLHYPPADPYGDRTHRRKVEPPSAGGGGGGYYNSNNYQPYGYHRPELAGHHQLVDAGGRPDVRPVYRPQSTAVVVNSKAVNGLQRPAVSPPLNSYSQPYSESPWQVAAPDTQWYKGDYQDAFQQTHEYYNLDVVDAPGDKGDQEYEYYEEEEE
jgi:hypothetical protein